MNYKAVQLICLILVCWASISASAQKRPRGARAWASLGIKVSRVEFDSIFNSSLMKLQDSVDLTADDYVVLVRLLNSAPFVDIERERWKLFAPYADAIVDAAIDVLEIRESGGGRGSYSKKYDLQLGGAFAYPHSSYTIVKTP